MSEFRYDHIYKGNQHEGRKGTRCRRVANGVGTYVSAVQIEFEDGVQVFVNRNTIRALDPLTFVTECDKNCQFRKVSGL